MSVLLVYHMLNHLSCSSCISTSSRCYYPPHPLFLPSFNCTTYSTYFTFCLSRVTTPLRLSSLLFVIHIPLCLICYVSPESWFHLKTLRQKSKIKKCTKVPLESWVMASAGIQLNKLSQDLSQMFVSHTAATQQWALALLRRSDSTGARVFLSLLWYVSQNWTTV